MAGRVRLMARWTHLMAGRLRLMARCTHLMVGRVRLMARCIHLMAGRVRLMARCTHLMAGRVRLMARCTHLTGADPGGGGRPGPAPPPFHSPTFFERDLLWPIRSDVGPYIDFQRACLNFMQYSCVGSL